MVRISASLVALSIFAGVLATPLKRDATTILTDITGLNDKTTALDKQIVAFNGDLLAALGIHSASQALDSSVKSATADVTCPDGTFSDEDAAAILSAVAGFAPSVNQTLTDIVAKKPVFAALPIGGVIALVHGDLANLGASTSSFGSALIACAPAADTEAATALKKGIDDAFAAAVAAYAS
jgi:hypothetical protein